MTRVRRFAFTLLGVLLAIGLVNAQAPLLPNALPQYFDSVGHPLAGGSLTFDAAGTTSPLAVYADPLLTTPLTNPVVLDSAGRPTSNGSTPTGIYLSSSSYKIILKDSSGVTIRTQDNVIGPSNLSTTAVQSAIASTVCGRLTLTTGVPVTTADVTAATTLRFTPYKCSGIGLYDGSTQWNLRTFSELSIAVPASTSQMYDVFAYDNSGSAALELLAWTNDTTRATALTTQDGIYVKTGATTRRYLGSFRTTAVSGQTEDSYTKRYVWNYYNRVRRPMRRIDPAVTWTYTTAAFRQANANTSNQFDVVVGVAEATISVLVQSAGVNAVASFIAVGVGEDSTSATATGCVVQVGTAVSGENNPTSASLVTMPAIGRHFYAWLEYSAASGTTTWNGTAATFAISGMTGWIEG